jgi:UDP:flavonoid glycosyltransferase YjiC (YdhE family)
VRVLFTTHPLPSHFQPLVPLARVLREAGHAVAFATGGELGPSVVALGFEFLAAGPDWREDPELEALREAMRQQLGPGALAFGLREIFARWAGTRMLPDVEAVVERWRPDLVVAEVSEFSGIVVAERRGLPACLVTFGVDMPAAVAKAAAGLPPDPDLTRAERLLKLCFAPPSYQPPALPLSPQTHVLRPEPFEGATDAALPAWFAALPRRPTVYATLGTVFADTPGVFEAIVDGLAGEPLNVVVTVSRDVDPERLRGRAPNLHVEQFIPHLELLPRCDAVVAHAGYGTVMGCLAAGVPMVLVPLGADQFLHADRLTALGAARTLALEALTPDAVRRAVRGILGEPAPRAAARRLRDEIASAPGTQRALALLDEFVRTGMPPRRL